MKPTSIIRTFSCQLPDQEILDRYLDKITCLPPAPTLMLKLIELFQQPDRDADELVGMIHCDPALAAELLRRCNSFVFGTRRQVLEINDAVFQLGFYEVYRMAMELSGMKAFTVKGNNKRNFPIEQLRRHSSITATAADVIARETGESQAVAFTTGLLHDIGKLAMATQDGAKYVPLLEKHGLDGPSCHEAEQVAFGFSHGHLGARLLVRWGVPEQITMPVWWHHHLNSLGNACSMTAILCLANLIAHHIEDENLDEFFELPEMKAPMDILKLNPERVLVLEDRVCDDLKQIVATLPRNSYREGV